MQINWKKVKSFVLNHKVLYTLLILAILNATLRITGHGMTSLYRLLSPFVFMGIGLFCWPWFKKEITLCTVAVIYGLTVSAIFYHTISVDMWAFLGYIVILYIFVMVIYHTTEDFTQAFFKFLNYTTIITLVLCWIQFFVRIPYPYLELARDPGVNVFMNNENELAAPLACMLIIYLYLTFFQKKWKYGILVANIAFFLYINDAKMSMLGVFMGVAVYVAYAVYLFFRKKFNIQPRTLFWIMCLSLVAVIALICVINPTIEFRDYTTSLKELALEEILDILLLRPTYGSGGSSIDRTNAIIFGIMELKKTAFFGIGWGNSIDMLAMPEYQLMTAKSMHNLIFQFLTEFGWLAIACYGCIFVWLIRRVKDTEKNSINIMKIAFAVSFVLISSQSSVGILSNYYMWMVVFYIALSYKEKRSKVTKTRNGVSTRRIHNKNEQANAEITE